MKGGWNLPPDWGMYYSKCSRCGKLRHASGVVECDCEYDEDGNLVEDTYTQEAAKYDEQEERRRRD